MYRVDRNDFYRDAKGATVYTPSGVSDFIFNVIHREIPHDGVIMDPCVGAGSLLKPFKRAGFRTAGIDIEDQGHSGTIIRDFISVQPGEIERPTLVVANPPFNIDAKTQELVAGLYGRRPLLPEIWLRKCIELWGKDLPLVLFAPYGLRLNQSLNSDRWCRFTSGDYPEIRSIIALPKDIYENVLFHSEILIFNVKGLRAHYFYDG